MNMTFPRHHQPRPPPKKMAPTNVDFFLGAIWSPVDSAARSWALGWSRAHPSPRVSPRRAPAERRNVSDVRLKKKRPGWSCWT